MNPTFEEFVEALKNAYLKRSKEDQKIVKEFAANAAFDLGNISDNASLEEMAEAGRKATEVTERFIQEVPEYKFLVGSAFVTMLLMIFE
jgi:hypothetical protein